jgi:hypothetical protein
VIDENVEYCENYKERIYEEYGLTENNTAV